MKRREFLQLLAASGMTASLPFSIRQAHAAAPDHFVICVGANGGWDPTSIMDPKGLNQAYPDRASGNYDGSVNKVALDDAKKFGNIQWSAIPDSMGEANQLRVEGQYDNFFTTYGDRMTVINGIDGGTNNHDTGRRHVFSGNLDMGYPNFAALYAGTVAPSLPMSFISNGGYDETAGLVAKARANSADYLSELSDPNYRNTSNDQKLGYHYRADKGGESVDLYKMIEAAQTARLTRQQSSEALPLRTRQLEEMALVRSEENNLSAMKDFVDQLDANLPTGSHMNNRNGGFKSQVQVAVSAMAAGLSAGAMLSDGGYDTHGNHDNSHYPNAGDLLEGLDYLMLALQELDLAGKTTVIIGSDFGRTPFYNSGNGKDHWNVTSMIVVQPTGTSTGGKVFGASDEQFNALPVNVQSGATDSSGIVITPAHVQKQLRKLVGIDSSLTSAGFPLSVEDINLFA